jgi:hypothetical protein
MKKSSEWKCIKMIDSVLVHGLYHGWVWCYWQLALSLILIDAFVDQSTSWLAAALTSIKSKHLKLGGTSMIIQLSWYAEHG